MNIQVGTRLRDKRPAAMYEGQVTAIQPAGSQNIYFVSWFKWHGEPPIEDMITDAELQREIDRCMIFVVGKFNPGDPVWERPNLMSPAGDRGKVVRLFSDNRWGFTEAVIWVNEKGEERRTQLDLGLLFDHEPHPVKKTDLWGEVTVWE